MAPFGEMPTECPGVTGIVSTAHSRNGPLTVGVMVVGEPAGR